MLNQIHPPVLLSICGNFYPLDLAWDISRNMFPSFLLPQRCHLPDFFRSAMWLLFSRLDLKLDSEHLLTSDNLHEQNGVILTLQTSVAESLSAMAIHLFSVGPHLLFCEEMTRHFRFFSVLTMKAPLCPYLRIRLRGFLGRHLIHIAVIELWP